jgi:hypothetical protein
VIEFDLLSRHFAGGTEKNLSQDSRSRGRDLNLAPVEYEACVSGNQSAVTFDGVTCTEASTIVFVKELRVERLV